MYLNRVSYSGTQVTGDTFTVSLAANAEAAADNEMFIGFVESNPNDGKYCSFEGYVYNAGTNFKINTVLQSSESDNSIPVFTGNVVIKSSVTDVDLERMSRGRAGVLGIGQSNMVGWNEERHDGDFFYSNVPQWDTINGYLVPSVEPLKHQTLSIGANNISYLPLLGNTMFDNGYKTVAIIPRAANGSGFSDNKWAKGQPQYESAVSATSAFLNDDPLNYLEAIIIRMGETDYQAGRTGTQFRDDLVTMFNNMKADIQTNTGQDVSKVPVVVIGLNGAYITLEGAAAVSFEAGLADMPNVLPYCSYLELPDSWADVRDGIHDTAETVRRVARKELLPKIIEAKANRLGIGQSVALTAVTGTGVAQTLTPPALPQSQTITAATGTGVAQSMSATAADPVSGTITAATGTGASQPITYTGGGVNTPLTDALSPTVHLRYDSGLNGTGPNYTSWTDLTGNGNDLGAAANGSPQITADGLTFDGDDNIQLWNDLTNGTSLSFIIKLKWDLGIYPFDFGNFLINASFNSAYVLYAGLSNNVSFNPTTVNDGVERTLAVTCDATSARVYVDGVFVAENTSITIVSTNSATPKLGSLQGDSNYWTGSVKGIVAAKNVKWTDQQVADIHSEMPA